MPRRSLVLLVLLTLIWGLNWPVMKAGVQHLPPLYFRTLCIAGGVAALYLYIRASGQSLTVARVHWPMVLKLAIPNVIAWHVLLIYGLTMLPAGRSAILAYTMPVWAVIFGLLVFREPVPRLHLLGVAAALAGALLLLSSEFVVLSGRPLGTLLVLAAAASWGYGTHLLRRHLKDVPITVLSFWMLACSLVVLGPASVVVEWSRWRMPTALEWGAIVYNMLLAIAFAQVVWSTLARTLPPTASALSVMLIPIVGVSSSMALLGEAPHWQDFIALALILVALSTVMLGRKPAPAPAGD
jgi:drug/metabolite transporter (DMT)-like permease